jgi:hypothetical protein
VTRTAKSRIARLENQANSNGFDGVIFGDGDPPSVTFPPGFRWPNLERDLDALDAIKAKEHET